jgi:transposase InsO family protein
LLPQRPTTVLSDNGSKFKANFAQLLKERGIKRWYTYPKTPKMIARRSIQSNNPGVLRG